MAHEHHGGLAVVIGGGVGGDGGDDRLEVIVGGQQGLAQNDLAEGILVVCQLVLQVVVLVTVHQMGGLDDEVLDAVGGGPVQSLGHVVDLQAVPLGQLVDDDLAGEGPADLIVGEGLLNGLLSGADGGVPALVVAGAEAHHQDGGVGVKFRSGLFGLHGFRSLRGLLLGRFLRGGVPAAGQQGQSQGQRHENGKYFLHRNTSFLSFYCFIFQPTKQKTAAPRPFPKKVRQIIPFRRRGRTLTGIRSVDRRSMIPRLGRSPGFVHRRPPSSQPFGQ